MRVFVNGDIIKMVDKVNMLGLEIPLNYYIFRSIIGIILITVGGYIFYTNYKDLDNVKLIIILLSFFIGFIWVDEGFRYWRWKQNKEDNINFKSFL